MKKIITASGIILVIITMVLAILYIIKFPNIKLAYCFISLIVCFLIFGIRRLYYR